MSSLPENQFCILTLSTVSAKREEMIAVLLSKGLVSFEELNESRDLFTVRLWLNANVEFALVERWFAQFEAPVTLTVQTETATESPNSVFHVSNFTIEMTNESTTDPGRIHLAAGVGFGWGDHPTTRLGLDFISKHSRDHILGQEGIDFGAGTGILSIAAGKCGATRIEAIEIDPAARQTIEINKRLNPLKSKIETLERLTEKTGHAQFILANLYAHTLSRFAEALYTRLRPGGYLWMSGFRTHQAEGVMTLMQALGAELSDRNTLEAWIGLTFRKPK